MSQWKIHRRYLDKFFKLSNGQYLKIRFSYASKLNAWNMDIVVANTKRKCNDCFNKTEFSPKVLYGKHTGHRIGVEALKIAKDELLKFEKRLHNTRINIFGASKQLDRVYMYLKRYGYTQTFKSCNGCNRQVMFKKII